MKKIRIAALLFGLLTLTLLIIAYKDELFGDIGVGTWQKGNNNSEVTSSAKGTGAGQDDGNVLYIEDDSLPYIIPLIEKSDDNDIAVDSGSDTGLSSEETTEIGSGDEVEQILSEMTLTEKLYQMLILTPEQLTGADQVTAAGDNTGKSLEMYPAGGLIYFTSNLISPDQTKEMLANTQEYAYETEGMPLFLCIDEEGGKVARIGSNAAFGVKKISPMASVGSEEEAYEAGRTIGEYLAALGFNVDFAPDTDVLTNKMNTVIGNRSFGADPDKVCRYANAYLNGLHNAGIIGTYKHFPGHGATSDDTHEGLAYTDKSLDELMEAELKPFADASAAGADMVMVSHISVPSILNDYTPCSLSKQMVTDILKGDIGYDGLVVTDSLMMGAVTEKYESSEAVIMAIEAGNDLLLMPQNHKSAVNRVIEEIENGRISEDRIDGSVRKIIRKKLKMREKIYY